MTRHRVLAAFLILELLDIASTWAFLAHGGAESNPFVAKAILAWGAWGVVVMKAATAAPILGSYAWLSQHGKPDLAWRSLVIACGGMLLVIAANITTGLALGLSPFIGLALILGLGTATGIAGTSWRTA